MIRALMFEINCRFAYSTFGMKCFHTSICFRVYASPKIQQEGYYWRRHKKKSSRPFCAFVRILSLDLNVKRVNHLFRSEGWYDRRFRDWMIDTTAESHINILSYYVDWKNTIQQGNHNDKRFHSRYIRAWIFQHITINHNGTIISIFIVGIIFELCTEIDGTFHQFRQ